MRSRLFVLAICAVLLAAPTAGAQRPFKIGLSAGPSLPTGFNDSHKIGINAAAFLPITFGIEF